MDRAGNALPIRTPEGVEFSLVPAGPLIRFFAWLIDTGCVITVTSVVAGILKVASLISLDFGMALITLASFLIAMGYSICCEWFLRGQTLGKKLLRLRVMDEQGLYLQFSQVVIRNLLRVVDMIPAFYLVGGLSAFFTRRSQRLGDIAASTIVVVTSELYIPDLEKLGEAKYNSLREYPQLAARLRQKVSGDEAALAMQALLRRDELDPKARIELFRELSEHFAALVKFPQEALEGMAGERYVQNVVEIVYLHRKSKHGAFR
jgi:uncharacterized RDD family membrane protein YckC